MNGQMLIDCARKQLNVKWRHQGRQSGTALDCVGLLYVVAAECGLNIEDMRNYSTRPGSKTLYEQLMRYCDEVPMEAVRRPADILVVSVAGEDPQHTALWTGERTILHASARHRKVVEHGFDDETRRGLCKIFRLRGLDG